MTTYKEKDKDMPGFETYTAPEDREYDEPNWPEGPDMLDSLEVPAWYR